MKAIIFATLLLGVAPVAAQPASALGQPRQMPNLPQGTVSVRVIAGSAANNVKGTDVTLVVNGTPRQARTDDTGHATFPGLAVGAMVQAQVKDIDGKVTESKQFAVPDGLGTAVMLSTAPMQTGMPGGAGPMQGGGGAGMPQPRQLSGEARPEPNDPAGMITVRLTYDDFAAAPPVGVPVTMVAYSWDDKIKTTVVASDKDGRASFTGLDRSGGTAYFMMATLPRNGAEDRLMSMPVTLAGNAGVRMVLSGEKRDSTAKPVDDLEKLEKQEGASEKGVTVALAGVPQIGAAVQLKDATTGATIAESKAFASPADPSHIQFESQFVEVAGAQMATLQIELHGGPGNKDEPIDDVEFKVTADGADAPVTAKTANGGQAMFLLKAGATGQATISMHGKEYSQKFALPKTGGGGAEFVAHWEAQGPIIAQFPDVNPVAVVYAESHMHNQTNRSLPFQPTGHGTRVTIYVLPRIMAAYHLGGEVEDQNLGVQGRFTLSNNAWAPYRGGPDGIVLPAPKGFRGGVVAEMDQNDVAVAPDEGFRIARPLAPGQKQFHAGFSLPIDAGEVTWKMDLPFGAFESGVQFRPIPGMQITPPGGVALDMRHVKTGEACANADEGSSDNPCMWVMDHPADGPGNGMTLMPQTQMKLSLAGLPAPPSWSRWMPRLLGLLVVGTMVTGVAFALARKPENPARHLRREELMKKLVELEKSGGDPAQREELLRELEALWTE